MLNLKTIVFSGLFSGALLAASVSFNTANAETIFKPKAVVELFTSQGCSSCPPADKVLGALVDEGDVLALSLPVDYWDYLGWPDTLGKAEHSERQRNYARGRKDRNVYTPQAVINGMVHVVGSRRPAIDSTISSMKSELGQETSLPVDINLVKGSTTLSIEVGSGDPVAEETTLWLIFYDSEHEVAIERGENRGETITYHNVVRSMRAIGMWKGDKMEVSLPLSEMSKNGQDNCAVILQSSSNGHPGRILGAARISGLASS